MKTISRVIITLSVLMGIWVIASFIGAMFDSGNAELWTTSLMWSLLASVFLMPGSLMAYDASSKREEQEEPSVPLRKQPAFVEDDAEGDSLWPDTETVDSSKQKARSK